MTKEELIASISGEMWVGKALTTKMVDAVFDSIAAALSRGEKVNLSGFGSFRVVTRAPKIGRNPHTGEPVSIPERFVPVFKAGKRLRETISGRNTDDFG